MKRAVVAFAIAAAAVTPARAADARIWRLTNLIECVQTGSNIDCGPAQQMNENHGNGTFPTGFLLIKDGEARIWVSEHPEVARTDFSSRTWTLVLGGQAVVTRATWTVGSYHWNTREFSAAGGSETVVTGSGSSVQTASMTVPGGDYEAIRISGAGGPNLIDTFDENGGDSPSALSVSN